MIAAFLAWCRRLDERLHARFGRPYGIVLTAGLCIEIAHRVMEAPERMHKAERLAPIILLILLNAALLLHQFGELGESLAGEAEGERAKDG